MSRRFPSLALTGLTGQTATYAGASMAGQLIAALSRIALASMLTVVAFGAFAFSLSFLQYGALLFEFGLFLPAGRLAARSPQRDVRGLIGAAVLLYAPVGALFAVATFIASFAVDSIFKVDAGTALLVASPLAIVYPFNFVALQLAQGVERLHVYALTGLLGQALFLVALLIVLVTAGGTSPEVAITLRSVSLGLGAAALIWWLRPRFARARQWWPTFVQGAREYGFEAYVGRVLSIGTYNMDVLMLGLFIGARSVALYALAGALAAAAGLPVTGLSAVLFRRMVSRDSLDPRWLRGAWALGGLTALAAWLLAPAFLGAVFPANYADVADYVGPLALAQVLRGVTSIYNTFLAAQGAGRPLRNAALVLTGSNVVLNVLLIPRYGAAGAAWASVLALLANYGAHVYGYRSLQRNLRAGRRAADMPGDPSIAEPDPFE